MENWFLIPEHLIIILVTGAFIIIVEGIIITKLLKRRLKQWTGNADDKIEWFRHFWSEFVIYVLATSVVGLFIVSMIKRDNITLADVNNWVSIILGFVALVVGVISLYLSFYNVDQANKAQQNIQETAKELSTFKGWKCDVSGHWHFYDISGQMVRNQWKKSGNEWFYLGADGELTRDSIIEDNGKIYYVDKAGVMVKNTWVHVGNKKYYMTEYGQAFMDGTMTIGGKEYMFENGYLKE